jgi:hypothetical protein
LAEGQGHGPPVFSNQEKGFGLLSIVTPRAVRFDEET